MNYNNNIYNEESGLVGEIISGIFGKKEKKAKANLETTKGLIELIQEKKKAESDKYILEQTNRIKTIKIVIISVGFLLVLIAIIIAIVQVKKAKLKEVK